MTTSPILIRPATEADAPRLLDIYRPYVEHTAVSFELEPPTVEVFAARIAKSLAGWAWLVAEVDGIVAGYAYGTAHRERAAYAKTVETGVYLDAAYHGRGVGRALYTELLRVLAAKGFHRAVAGITLPNPASVGLHERFGFERIGVYKEVGFKFGRWHDTVWYQRGLG
jgi:L-amino acid N-acyltransferase YncA